MRSRHTASRLDAEALYGHAVRALARRPRTEDEMRRLLARRAAPGADIESVLARLRASHYLDDRRLAEAFAQYQRDVERHGRARVARELRRRGVAAATVAGAVAGAYAETREAAQLRAYIRKKRQQAPATWPETLRLFRAWLRAGFSAASARQCLRQWKLEPEWIEALEEAEADEATPEP